MSLKGKTIFITGASRGIGEAIAVRCARDGANVAIAARAPMRVLPARSHAAAYWRSCWACFMTSHTSSLQRGQIRLRLLEERRFSVQPSSTDAGNALTSRPRFLASAVTMLSCQSNAALRQ